MRDLQPPSHAYPPCRYAHAGWGDAEACTLAVALPLAVGLRQLELGDNHIGDAGVTAIATAMAAGAIPRVEGIFLHSNAIGKRGMAALAQALAGGAAPALRRIFLDGNPASREPECEAVKEVLRARKRDEAVE